MMMKLIGKIYVQGTLNISARALETLKTLGITPPWNKHPQGGDYDSFYMPEGAEELFTHKVGNPATPGYLDLK